jgi:hypothetical protein
MFLAWFHRPSVRRFETELKHKSGGPFTKHNIVWPVCSVLKCPSSLTDQTEGKDFFSEVSAIVSNRALSARDPTPIEGLGQTWSDLGQGRAHRDTWGIAGDHFPGQLWRERGLWTELESKLIQRETPRLIPQEEKSIGERNSTGHSGTRSVNPAPEQSVHF